MTDAASTASQAPDLSIRTRPPSPKRLSRKVLFGGATILGAIIAGALVVGLSDTPRRYGGEREAASATAGPPESIQSASGEYESSALGASHGATTNLSEEDVLAPPRDPGWDEAASGAGAAGAANTPITPDPHYAARTAPILFARDVSGAPPSDGDRLDARLMPPRSAYELLSGAIIPAALMTELNSDLPGRVIAQVTAPVFDSVTGRHLLIPQGARLIGAYDTGVRYGESRILLIWNRLILPNGWSINLQGMQGGDAGGASGLSDRTDHHLDRLAVAIGLSAIVSVVATNAEGEYQDQRLRESVSDAAAQEAARTGGRIIDREMSVRPTLRIRAGAPVRVLVTRDIELGPYRAAPIGAP
jgi:type IV secretory pathway VirB10-like protein